MTEPVCPADGYDIFSPEYRNNPYPLWDAIRESGCPLARTDEWGGSWLLTRYADVHDLGRDMGRLSARAGEASGSRELTGSLFLPPLTSDAPAHKSHRDLLMPFFVPTRMQALEPLVRRQCRTLAETIAAQGGGDAVSGFSQPLTVVVLCDMLGIPPGGQIIDWVVRMMRSGAQDQEIRIEAIREIIAYLSQVLDERAAEPSRRDDDVITYLLHATMDGEPINRRHQIGAAFLFLIAGADTTWSAIGASLWHLATHPDDRRRLCAEPALMESAVEELLRAYAPVTMGRRTTCELELHGRHLAVNERLLMNFPAANRDPEVFPEPHVVNFDRPRNRHIAFGSGAHRCLGAPLARLEMRVSLEEWLRAMPDFALADPANVEWSGGQVRGPKRLDVLVT